MNICDYIIALSNYVYRERKLQETLLAVQQLDVSMSNLRKWLADMENDLAAPIVYMECDRKEIQKKLQHQNVSYVIVLSGKFNKIILFQNFRKFPNF